MKVETIKEKTGSEDIGLADGIGDDLGEVACALFQALEAAGVEADGVALPDDRLLVYIPEVQSNHIDVLIHEKVVAEHLRAHGHGAGDRYGRPRVTFDFKGFGALLFQVDRQGAVEAIFLHALRQIVTAFTFNPFVTKNRVGGGGLDTLFGKLGDNGVFQVGTQFMLYQKMSALRWIVACN